MGRFLAGVERSRGVPFADYEEAWRWSVDDLDDFWRRVAGEFDVALGPDPRPVLTSRDMPGARWFPNVRLNYAEHLLRREGDGVAIVSISQSRAPVRVTWDVLRTEVRRCASGLRRLGVGVGDHVAAYLPNQHEAVIGFLAAASLGAVWSSCSPDTGSQAVLGRFGQIRPRVLITVTAYRYGTQVIDRSEEVDRIRRGLPHPLAVVEVPFLPGAPALTDAVAWDDLMRPSSASDEIAPPDEPSGADLPFEHPLFVLYSSGSTGPPKAIVHGHGGILLEHLKVLGLHHDLGDDDVVLWLTTTGWMMWNYLVSCLLLGSRVILYDGEAWQPDGAAIWRLVAEHGVTVAGMGAAFLIRSERERIRAPSNLDLGHLRQVGSTGSPLPATAFEWVVDAIAPRAQVVSISGGTDVCTAVMAGNPLIPVRAGEIQSRCLGADVAAVDSGGSELIGGVGEMVIGSPLPSMPIAFVGDETGERYRAAYFEDFPGRWRHGDWLEIRPGGGCVVSGRSDATLNRGGIRSGTSEYYAVVERTQGVLDSLVVHVADEGGGLDLLVLLVVVPEALQHDQVALELGLRRSIREELSPRHVPDEILVVPALPRTASGKRIEVPVKRFLLGGDPSTVVSPGALDRPDAWRELVEVLSPLRRSIGSPDGDEVLE